MPATSITSLRAAPCELIIDTDPGADDLVALLLAMASPDELSIRAITTVAGNVHLAKTSRNARLACEWGGGRISRCMPGPPGHWYVRLSMPPNCTVKKA